MEHTVSAIKAFPTGNTFVASSVHVKISSRENGKALVSPGAFIVALCLKQGHAYKYNSGYTARLGQTDYDM